MFGKILYIGDNIARVALIEGAVVSDIMNLHVIFEDEKKQILGEVDDISEKEIKISFLGEIVNGIFIGGVIRKPSLTSKIRPIKPEEMKLIIGDEGNDTMLLGYSPLYDACPIRVKYNDLFSNHMAIFGNTGSGKSCGVARLLQNVFNNKTYLPFRSNIFLFDAYGEYHNAFRDLNKYNINLNFKYYTTNLHDSEGEILRIPLWLLDVDDLAILLGATNHGQITILERALKLVEIFAENDEGARKYKNHLIAKAIMTILYTNQTSASKRNDIFSIIQTCSTPEFNLETIIQGIGYQRRFRECFIIDTAGNFCESVLITQYIQGFINDELEKYEAKSENYYTLDDFEQALSFTLISEGFLRNGQTYGDAVTLKVKLHALVIGENKEYFNLPSYITREKYIASLISSGNKKVQIINFNLEEVDDHFAKAVTKIFTKMLFNFAKSLKTRASIPFHIFLEEAHRYVKNDEDTYLIGYNIFERVAKEGRKYGVLLNLISQRPVELSETVISQCSNFMIFKMNHPRDLEYIKMMLPNINNEIVEKQKSLQPGTCVAFGKAFKIPMIVKMQMPDPAPYSSSCNVYETWKANRE